MPIFWKAVLFLEKCGSKVVSYTADGASPNQKNFRIHKALECNPGKDVVYSAKNIHAKENRFIYSSYDVPHLIKTARNCISNSASGRTTRFMFKIIKPTSHSNTQDVPPAEGTKKSLEISGNVLMFFDSNEKFLKPELLNKEKKFQQISLQT